MSNIARSLVRWIVPRSLRNWLRRPGVAAAWLRDGVAHALGADRAVEIRPGWSLLCHPAAYRLAYRAHLEDPEQVPELDAFIASCTPGMVLLDLGAHFGLFSLAALRYGGKAATAIAVDPSPAAARMLAVQARLNEVVERLRIVRAAVGARDGELALVDAGVASAGYFVPPEPGHARRERTTVPALTIDTIVRQAGAHPTHIKVDVEGFEADALRGATTALAGPRAPILFIELHNAIVAQSGRDPAETLEILGSLGYSVFGLDGAPIRFAAILGRPLVRVVARQAKG